MTDQELAQMINRIWHQDPQSLPEADPSTKTLLCFLFRELGRRDPEGAFANLLSMGKVWLEKYGDPENRHINPLQPLHFAIWAGHGEIDPAAVWTKLCNNTDDFEAKLPFDDDESPEMRAVLEQIFTSLLDQSPESAIKAIEIGRPHRDIANRILLANMTDADQRVTHYRKWVYGIKDDENSPARTMSELPEVPPALAGIAVSDQSLMSQLLPDPPYDPDRFIKEWARLQPQQAIEFFLTNNLDVSRGQTPHDLVAALAATHPEEAVHYLARLPKDENSNPFSTNFHLSHWPVVEGMKPGIPTLEAKMRVRRELDKHPLDSDILTIWILWLNLKD